LLNCYQAVQGDIPRKLLSFSSHAPIGSYIMPGQLSADLGCEPKTTDVELKTSAVAALIFSAH